MDDVLTVQLLPWSESGSRFLSGGLHLNNFSIPLYFLELTAKDEGFFKYLEVMGWKHRELFQIIKNIAARYIYERGAGERNFLLGRRAGLLSKLSTETQSVSL